MKYVIKRGYTLSILFSLYAICEKSRHVKNYSHGEGRSICKNGEDCWAKISKLLKAAKEG